MNHVLIVIFAASSFFLVGVLVERNTYLDSVPSDYFLYVILAMPSLVGVYALKYFFAEIRAKRPITQ